ncbi:MAG: sigma-54-dependent Fis family transcriptional regulator [Desulfitobacterium hafniense]|nr:sigma-54-dependent Fis family transcriptional regulator [Desulfitobacterium hafniense]
MSDLWKMFVNGEENIDNVKVEIQQSWQRSKNYKINHQRFENTDILTVPQLNERCQSHELLVRAAKNVLPTLFKFLKGLNHIVLLSDQDGYILESVGEPTFLNKVQKVQVSPGTNWREDVRGTNAVGTILHEQVPMTVFSWEHYVQQVHFIDCWAAPIKGPKGETIGVLDISAEASQKHSDNLLELAITGARLIELNLQLYQIKQAFSIYKQGFHLAGQMLQDGLIAIDYDGVITDINHAGASLLGYKREDIIGRLAVDVFKSKSWAFKGEASKLHLEMKNGRNVLTQLRQVTDVVGNTIGAVGTLSLCTTINAKTALVGCSELFKDVIRRAEKIAQTNATVLITGESGTGKENVAHFIHEKSHRRGQAFVPLNCAAIPQTLLESELFGYAEGSFTGAKRGGQPGKFEVSDGGTIFLDEVGEMPLNAQASLLRVLQEKEVCRIGEARPRKIDVRIIAATNQDLDELTKGGKFRLDLYYRLNVVNISIPPLRKRVEDLFELIPYLVSKACKAHNKPLFEVSHEIYDYFMEYTWPGNVRELENYIESMIVMSESHTLCIDDLPPILKKSTIKKQKNLDQHTRNATTNAILTALKEANGNRGRAAQTLGIGRTTLYRKMKELKLS